MNDQTTVTSRFDIKDCAPITLATGRKAVSLTQFRDILATIDPASVYEHFWGGLLQPRFEEREFNNDFAGWIKHGLHDGILAEQLAIIDPTDYADLEHLRLDLIELIDSRLDEAEYLYWARPTRPFEFLKSQLVVFGTGRSVGSPGELDESIPHLSLSSLFYHFIDARRRNPDHLDDFRSWLTSLPDDYSDLEEALARIDPYFGDLAQLREELTLAFRQHLGNLAGETS